MLTTLLTNQGGVSQAIICTNWIASTNVYSNAIVIGEQQSIDTSDILDRYTRRRSESKEEEAIAAQLLKARQKRPEVERQHRKLVNWKKLIYKAIYGAETIEELEAIKTPSIPTDSPEIVAAILAEIEQQKAAKKAEIELKQATLKLKMEEASLQAVQLESEISARIEQQKLAIQAIKELQQQVMERHAIAVEKARQMEMQSFLELQEAEQKAQEFTRKRNNRIKRLKAMMWLAKLDL